MLRRKSREFTPKEDKELLWEFERIHSDETSEKPPAPPGEFEKIMAEMKKRNIVPQIKKEL